MSGARAAQSVAAALVGHTAMTLMGIEAVAVCPWAVREGLLPRTLGTGGRQA